MAPVEVERRGVAQELVPPAAVGVVEGRVDHGPRLRRAVRTPREGPAREGRPRHLEPLRGEQDGEGAWGPQSYCWMNSTAAAHVSPKSQLT